MVDFNLIFLLKGVISEKMSTPVLLRPTRLYVGPEVTGIFRDILFLHQQEIGIKEAKAIVRRFHKHGKVRKVCEDRQQPHRLMEQFLTQAKIQNGVRTVFSRMASHRLQYHPGSGFLELHEDGRFTLYVPARLRKLRIQQKMCVLEKGRLVPARVA